MALALYGIVGGGKMGLMGGIAGGILRQMPLIDARHQRDTENERADLKQEMWLRQQQRIQDQYDQEQKRLSADRRLAVQPGLMRGYSDFVGPPDPQMQQVLDYASPQMLRSSSTYKTDAEKLQGMVDQLMMQEGIKAQFRPESKPGSDPLSMFISVTGRKPNTLDELSAFAQSLKGKSGLDLTTFGPNGKPILSMGRGSMPPGTLTKGSEGAAQKKVMESATGLDSADELLGNIKLDWFSGPTQVGMAVKGAADKWLGGTGPKTKEEIADYSAGMAAINKQANEEIHRLTGAQMSAAEADRLLKAIPNEKDGPAQALGKLRTFYNGLAMAQARYKFFLDQNRGQKPTEEDFKAFSNGKNASQKLAILAQYGYKPLSIEGIRAKIGTSFNQEQPSQGQSAASNVSDGKYDLEWTGKGWK